ncbi:MAG: C40 family peptidase [Clostridia bacterium]|nr:C40 family peptidase [Clostridia bacterium]
MLKKRLTSYMIIAGLLTSGMAARADEPCDYEYFIDNMLKLGDSLGCANENIEVPEEYNTYSDIYLKAAARGLVGLDELDSLTGNITKQDAAAFLYTILIKADPEYEISSEQAEEILNTCYDNAYLKDENKIAYASMIRHGIISARGLTYPDKLLTAESVTALKNRVLGLFEKKLPVTVGEKTICIGSSIDEMFSKFGEPDRIDSSEYGFDWYVYNSYYSDFIMIGVKDDVVSAYFTNAKTFVFDGLHSGDMTVYKNDIEGLQVFYDANGAVDSVWYNPYSVTSEYNEHSQFAQLLDMVNAYRAKSGLLTLLEPAPATISPMVQNNIILKEASVPADNALEAYLNLFLSDEGLSVLTHNFGISSILAPKVEYTLDDSKNIWSITAIDPKKTILAAPKNKQSEESEDDTEEIKDIKTPTLISPENEETTSGNGVKLILDKRCADRYLVTLYNMETESYDVNAYLDSNKKEIVIPSYMLTKGNKYRACVTAVSQDRELTGNTVEFTYGECEVPLAVASPSKELSTYDDELEISAYSSAYRDFRVDVYNSKNKIVLTKELTGTNECVLESLPAGKYYVCVTAVSHATGMDMVNAFSTVEIKKIVPIITETILEPGQTYNYYYGDGKEWIYFYDTETIAVSEDRIITVPVEDMSGDPDPAENTQPAAEEETGENTQSDAKAENTENSASGQEQPVETEKEAEEPSEAPAPEPEYEQKTETVTVYKTKITQRKVPATKKYRALAGLIPERTHTTGAFIERSSSATPTETGNAIAAMALSYQGVPYLWGGTSPSGFDCSGLVKYVCNSLGIRNVARTSAQQFATSGIYVEKKDLIPGDLVFFQENGRIHHVGIYIGNNMMVHAPHTGDVVKISSLSDSYYQREYAGAKRVS